MDQQELGEVVFVELPEAGAKLEKGSTFGVVESVKAASDVYSPVSGTVVEANEILGTDPGLVGVFPLFSHYYCLIPLLKLSRLCFSHLDMVVRCGFSVFFFVSSSLHFLSPINYYLFFVAHFFITLFRSILHHWKMVG